MERSPRAKLSGPGARRLLKKAVSGNDFPSFPSGARTTVFLLKKWGLRFQDRFRTAHAEARAHVRPLRSLISCAPQAPPAGLEMPEISGWRDSRGMARIDSARAQESLLIP